MSSTHSYRINTPSVVHETIDNEVIIIDFNTGNYFSLDNVGALIWNSVAAELDMESVNANVCNLYGRRREEVEPATARFVAELIETGLILEAPGSQAQGPAPLPAAADGMQPDRPYAPPVLNRYNDMQQLLLLDPIHDVDETGWPNLPEEISADAA